MSSKQSQPEPPIDDGDRCVNTRDAAKILGLSTDTLNAWRLRAEGPAFRRFGRLIRYNVRDLRTYMDRCKVGGGR